MTISYHPLIKLQRELYAIPRGSKRFNTYIKTLRDPQTQDMRLPLSVMNPMGKDHIPKLLDAYLGMNADVYARECLERILPQLDGFQNDYQAALVMADDAHGMWSERHSVEYGERFETKPNFSRGWLTGLLWTSERPSLEHIRLAVETAVFRGLYIEKHGFAKSLRQMMAQEGFVQFKSGVPQLQDAEEIDYSREIITPYLDAEEHPIIMSAIFGDVGAELLGYAPLGLSERAGLMVALADEQK